MALVVKSSEGGAYHLVPEGLYVGVCYGLIDLGTQYVPAFQKHQRKVMLLFELPEDHVETPESNMPASIAKEYTASLSDKASLRRDLEAWRGKEFTPEELSGFNLANILARGCQMQINHKKNKDGARTYAVIKTIMSLGKMPCPKPENTLVCFDFDDDKTHGVLSSLPDWIKKKIMAAREWQDFSKENPEIANGFTPVGDDEPLF